MGTWTKIDRAGAAYVVLNTLFWWGPVFYLASPSWFWTAIVLGLARDVLFVAAWLGYRGYRTVRLQRSLT